MRLRAASVASHAWLVCAFSVPLLIVVAAFICFVLSFYSSSIPHRPHGKLADVSTSYHPWKTPARYEASVYASLEESVPGNATQFFETAQLLWHVGPQDTTNKYPKLHKEVSVDIPRKLRAGDPSGPVLFAHIFLQEAGQLTPHPNVTDPHLAHAVAALALWDSLPQSSDDAKALSTSSLAPDPEHLIATTSVSWALLLEEFSVDPNVKFRSSLNSEDHSVPNQAYYNPTVFLNSITKSTAPYEIVLTRVSSFLPAPVFPRSFRVIIDLDGIHKACISAKAMLESLSKGHIIGAFDRNTTTEFEASISNSWLHEHQIMAKGNLVQYFIHTHSLGTIFWFVLLAHALIVLLLFALATSSLYWMGPLANWAGVSRVSLAMMVANDILSAFHILGTSGSLLAALFDLSHLINGYIVMRMLGMPSNPLKWPQKLYRRAFRIPCATADDLNTPNSFEKSCGSAPESRQRDRIIAARKSIDNTSMYWIRRACIPVAAIAALFAFFNSESGLWSAEFVERFGLGVSITLVSTCLVPQIVLNYQLRTGSLLPPTDYIFAIIGFTGEVLISYITGYKDENTYDKHIIPYSICNIIVIAQWIWYYKNKQD
ncbi:hypothetical protein H4S08_000241 [Coemansia sp. RSA 1365]|nr:hypothetical protein H4S08_000241 [Coemansia sp. RSA 1365]